MMIWKYPLDGGHELTHGALVTIPGLDSPRVLTAGPDLDGRFCVWVEHEGAEEAELLVVVVYWTGMPFAFDERLRYVNTVEHDGLLWHVYAGLA